MGFEIEFFPVGEASKAGDAIAVRYGQPGNYEVILIDGGTDASGEAVVEHVKTVYGAHTVVSHVISTHPDGDHSCGLRHILRELPVENLWIHGLWHHVPQTMGLFADTRWNEQGLVRRIKEEYPVIVEIFELANAQGARIYEPFQSYQIGPFTVLSPSPTHYRYLMPQFKRTPECNKEIIRSSGMWIQDVAKQSLFSRLVEQVTEKLATWIDEQLTFELLREGGITSAENESCTVLYGVFDHISIVLTADVGVRALGWSCDYANSVGIYPQLANVVQIPHHGSRRNVSPSALDRLVGQKLAPGSPFHKTAIVSAPRDDQKHPKNMVLNAFMRRGAKIAATQGSKYRWYSDMPARYDEGPPKEFTFFSKVEAYD
jgi:beta-lactamase superfamily II metal-dependent hydrolase